MTTAQQISGELGDDGQVWETTDGRTLDELCNAHTRPDYRDGHGTDTYRWAFDDGSVITVAGSAWDLGYPDCYCWQGAGHDTRPGECEARDDGDLA